MFKYLFVLGFFALTIDGISCDLKQQLIDRAVNLHTTGHDALPLVKSDQKASALITGHLETLTSLISNFKLVTESQVLFRLEYELIEVEKRLIGSIHKAHINLAPDNGKLHDLLENTDSLFHQVVISKDKLKKYLDTSELARELMKSITEKEAELKELIKKMKVVTISHDELVHLEQEVFSRIRPLAVVTLSARLKCCSTGPKN